MPAMETHGRQVPRALPELMCAHHAYAPGASPPGPGQISSSRRTVSSRRVISSARRLSSSCPTVRGRGSVR
jgi:hypothetical protein